MAMSITDAQQVSAVGETVYNRFKYRSAAGLSIWGGALDARCLLLETTVAGAFDPDLDSVADLLAVVGVAELVATNYARKALAGEAAAVDDANDRANLSMTAVTWTALGVAGGGDGSIVAVVVYDEGGGADASRWLISYHDTGFPLVTNGGVVILTAGDVLRLT